MFDRLFDRAEHLHARAMAQLANEGTTAHARSGGYRACARACVRARHVLRRARATSRAHRTPTACAAKSVVRPATTRARHARGVAPL